MHRWFSWVTVLGLLLLGSRVSFAQESRVDSTSRQGSQTTQEATGKHFDPASPAWNGCSQLVHVAVEEGLQVEAPRVWDWSQARVQDPILILSPQNEELDPKPLYFFVHAGGRVLLADDFGSGERLWETFGLQGRRSPVPPSRNQPLIDVHYTTPHPGTQADFLLRQASFSFLNVPQWFFISPTDKMEPLLYAQPYRSNLPDSRMEGYVLMRGRRGAGSLLVLSDPSALINQMIPYGDNRRLARNLIRSLYLPTQAKKLIVLWGDFTWKGKYKHNVPVLAQTSLVAWDLLTDFNSALTSMPALLAAYPPHWSKKGSLAAQRYKVQKSRSDALVRQHLRHLANKWWMVALLLLGWIAIGLRWMPWFPERTYNLEREQEHHIIPHRLTEQVDAHHSSTEDFLWPAIVLKEEFARFLHRELPELEPRTQRKRKLFSTASLPAKLPTELRSTDLSRYPLGLRVWHQLIQYYEDHHKPEMPNPQWKQVYALLTKVPDRRDWEQALSQSVKIKGKEMNGYYQGAMYCLHQLGLQSKFRAPLREREKQR